MTAAVTEVAAVPLAGTWRDVVALLKLRIDALVVCVALAAAVAAGTTSAASLAVLALACLLASAGASSLNHFLDRRVDERMARTRSRPLPSGRLSPRVALWLGLGLVGLSQTAAAGLGLLPALYLLAGAPPPPPLSTRWVQPRPPRGIAP